MIHFIIPKKSLGNTNPRMPKCNQRMTLVCTLWLGTVKEEKKEKEVAPFSGSVVVTDFVPKCTQVRRNPATFLDSRYCMKPFPCDNALGIKDRDALLVCAARCALQGRNKMSLMHMTMCDNRIGGVIDHLGALWISRGCGVVGES